MRVQGEQQAGLRPTSSPPKLPVCGASWEGGMASGGTTRKLKNPTEVQGLDSVNASERQELLVDPTAKDTTHRPNKRKLPLETPRKSVALRGAGMLLSANLKLQATGWKRVGWKGCQQL